MVGSTWLYAPAIYLRFVKDVQLQYSVSAGRERKHTINPLCFTNGV